VNKIDYQRILFKTAMLVMVCDGNINAQEMEEMELAFDKELMFTDLNFHEELARMMVELNQNKKKLLVNYFVEVEDEALSPVQTLKILEIALRITYADNRVETNEIRFLKLLKSRLKIVDEIFIKRFGEVDFLTSRKTSERIADTAQAFATEVELPDFGDAIEISKEEKS